MFQSFLSLLYPRVCVHCRQSLVKGEDNLCTACLENLPVNEKISDFEELRQEIVASHLFKNLFYFLKFYKNGITQSILHHIKYEGNTDLATSVGTWFGNNLQHEGFCQHFDLIIPVPLHLKKLRKRGYNQSDYIVRGMLEPLKSITDSMFLTRTVNNPTQTHKNRTERMKNVDNIFKVILPKYDKNARILLVDDVVTTGATLESCAKALNDAGYDHISFAAVAYARK